jgi:hypothetical protein
MTWKIKKIQRKQNELTKASNQTINKITLQYSSVLLCTPRACFVISPNFPRHPSLSLSSLTTLFPRNSFPGNENDRDNDDLVAAKNQIRMPYLSLIPHFTLLLLLPLPLPLPRLPAPPLTNYI